MYRGYFLFHRLTDGYAGLNIASQWQP